jgi:hypothetical protein
MNKKKLVKRNLRMKIETKTTIKRYASKVVTQFNIWQLIYKKKKFIIKDLEKKMQYGPIWINRKLKNHD